MRPIKCGMIAALISIVWVVNACAGTLDDVRARGHVVCGVSPERPGFASKGEDGRWRGFDVDTCRAVAAAVLGAADKVSYTQLSSKERFSALQAGEVDLLARSTTWTMLRDTGLEVNFAPVTFYDGQGFLVLKDFGLASAKELDGAVICTGIGTTSELNLSDFAKSNGLDIRVLRGEFPEEDVQSYVDRRCDALTGDRSNMAGYRSSFANPDEHIVLPDAISKEPLSPVVRHGDDQWFDIVKWTVFALIQAEESGVTSDNVDEMKASQDPTIQRLLGVSGDMGRQMGLSDDWAYEIVRQVGNYGEIYERNVGPDTPLGLERGLNALWTYGGLLYAMPFR